MVRADKVLSLLGIAARAKRIASGEFQTEHAVKSGEAYLVMVANDASENTKNVSAVCANIIRFPWRFTPQEKS